jgi:hypothetical protein
MKIHIENKNKFLVTPLLIFAKLIPNIKKIAGIILVKYLEIYNDVSRYVFT